MLGGGDGRVPGEESPVEFAEFLGAFAREADGLGEAMEGGGGKAVTDGVGGGAGFSLGRYRPMGFLPVGVGGSAAGDWRTCLHEFTGRYKGNPGVNFVSS